MDRREVPILIYPQTFLSNSRNQSESGYEWVFKGALCALQWTTSSRGDTKLSKWPTLTLKSTSVCKSSLRPFCFVLMMLKCCTISMSHEGSLCVHVWMAQTRFILRICHTCTVCQVGNISEERPGSWQWGLPPPLAGIQPESVSCCVMLSYVMGEKDTFALQLGL